MQIAEVTDDMINLLNESMPGCERLVQMNGGSFAMLLEDGSAVRVTVRGISSEAFQSLETEEDDGGEPDLEDLDL